MKDLTVFLDRYTRSRSDSNAPEVYRKVVGYEVPVLTRTSVSARAKMLLKPKFAPTATDSAPTNNPTEPSPAGVSSVDFPPRPSVVCDPFFLYSCNRSKIKPMYEVDIFVGELAFSLSDRQLQMISQLLKIASSKIDLSSNAERAPLSAPLDLRSQDTSAKTAETPQMQGSEANSINLSSVETGPETKSKGKESWLGWAMNVLGGSDDEEEDALVSEIIAETKEALLRANTLTVREDLAKDVKDGPFSLVSCLRVCIRTVSLTLRKHSQESHSERQDVDEVAAGTNTEELVPVANLGLVRVPVQTTKSRVSRPAKPLCTLRLHYSALEAVLVQGSERKSDLVFEIERVELLSVGGDDRSGNLDGSIFHWGSIDTAQFADCVSHPYFINSFYGEESRQLNRRDTRSFELVKVSFDTEIPVWKTLESKHSAEQEFSFLQPCACSVVWKGGIKACIPTATLHSVCQEVTRIIGLKERVLDGKSLLAALAKAMKARDVPVQPTKQMQGKLTDIAREYQKLRSPDLGAAENMRQMLEPQLFALLSRQTLHSCGAESLSSSCRSNDIRRRSVHSAVRFRLCSSRYSQSADDFDENGSSLQPDNSKRSSRVLDLSFGQAEGSLDLQKCDGIIDLVTCFISDGLGSTEGGKAESKTALDEEEIPREKHTDGEAKADFDDIKLITFSKLCLEVPNPRKQLGTLALLVRDAVYFESRRDGTEMKSVSLGELSVSCKSPPSFPAAAECLSQVIGAEFAMHNVERSEKHGREHARSVHVAVDKAMTKASDDGIFSAIIATNGLLAAIRKPRLSNPVFRSPRRSKVFWLELCNASLVASETTSCRLDSLRQRSLEAEIGSITLSSSAKHDPVQLDAEFQSGFFPLGESDGQDASSSPFLSCAFTEDKTRGATCTVPLLPRFLTSDSGGELFDSHPLPVYSLRLSARVAEFDVNVRALFDIAAGVVRVQDSVKGSWGYKQEDRLELQNQHIVGTLHSTAQQKLISDVGVPAKWHIVVNLSCRGGLAHVNEVIDLTIPALSVSSPERRSTPDRKEAGGRLELSWKCGDLKLSMVTPSEGDVGAGRTIFSMQGWSGQVVYDHQVAETLHIHGLEGSIHITKICVDVSRLTVRAERWFWILSFSVLTSCFSTCRSIIC